MIFEVKKNSDKEAENIVNTRTSSVNTGNVRPGLSIQLNTKHNVYVKEIASVIAKAKLRLVCFSLAAVVMAVLEVLLMYKIEGITDLAFAGSRELVMKPVTEAACMICAIIPLSFIHAKLQAKYIRESTTDLKNEYLKKLMTFEPNKFFSNSVTEYLSQMTNEMVIAENSYFAALYSVMYQGILLVAGIILAMSVSWTILVFSAVVLLVLYAFIAMAAGRMGIYAEAMYKAYEQYTKRSREFLSAFSIIKANNLEKKAEMEIYKEISKVQSKKRKLSMYSAKINVFAQLAASVVSFGFMAGMVYYYTLGKVSAGKVMFILMTFLFVFMPGVQVFQTYPELKKGRTALEHISNTLKNGSTVGNEVTDDGQKLHKIEKFSDEIIGEHISFGYTEDKKVLDDFSFKLKRGGKYLVTGPSGSGKSTFLKILRRYIEPTEGRILIDSEPLKDIEVESLFKRMAYMSQQVFLFEDTIRNNICLYKDYAEEHIVDILKKVGLSEFIESLPQGLDYVVEQQGRNISGGEKARIALARTLISEAEIILLDEPFANLDDAVVLQIENMLLESDLTIVNVSHVIEKENFSRYDEVIQIA